jgi:hypothetical protein
VCLSRDWPHRCSTAPQGTLRLAALLLLEVQLLLLLMVVQQLHASQLLC